MPFTLFCHNASPEQAHAFLDDNNAVINGDADKWQATFIFEEGGMFRKKRTIIHINYDREFCSPPNWSGQIAGMGNYLEAFEMGREEKAAMRRLVSQFKFNLGIVMEPEYNSENEDMRLDVIHSLADELKATIFAPNALLDANFRPFYEVDGDVDPDADFPDVPALSIEANDEKDDREPDPPDAQTVARRLFAMVGLAARGLLDMNKAQGNRPSYSLKELNAYIEAIGVIEAFDVSERRIMKTKAGKLAQQDIINSVWCLEGLVVLAWSLGLADLPAYDAVVETDKLLTQLGMGDSDFAIQTIRGATLRPRAELDKYAEQIVLFHWRMVDFRVRPEAIDFREVKIWGDPDLSWASLVDDDLVISGAPIALADPNAVGTAGSIAQERHQASNWLAGHHPIYAQVDTST